MKHGNALRKNVDCFWCAIDMQIKEVKVRIQQSNGVQVVKNSSAG